MSHTVCKCGRCGHRFLYTGARDRHFLTCGQEQLKFETEVCSIKDCFKLAHRGGMCFNCHRYVQNLLMMTDAGAKSQIRRVRILNERAAVAERMRWEARRGQSSTA